MLLANAFKRIVGGLFNAVIHTLSLTGVAIWDSVLTLINLITPYKRAGSVIAQGKPGAMGIWPQYMPPTEGDSRCSCPALNTLANHGLLPRDGKNIPFKHLSKVINETFRFAPSFCYFVPWYASQFLQRSYWKDTMDLRDLDVHNCIEHDASLTRWDASRQPDQSKPALDLIDELLANATGDGGKRLTAADISRFTEKRRAHSRATNGQYTLSTNQRFFGSSNSATLILFLGGNVDDLRVFLKEERFPDNWETKVRSQMGMTLTLFNKTASQIEFGIDESRGGSFEKLKSL